MNSFPLFFRNFMVRAFQKKTAFLVHFVAPSASFLAMFLLLRATESPAFAGTQAIGLIVYFTMLQAVLVVSLTMKDKEQGVLSRIEVSPASRASYVAGNGAAAFLVLSAQLLISSSLICFAFPVRIGLDFAGLASILLVYAVASVGFAFLICALSDTSSQAMITANVAIMFSSLLGGSFFPVDFMSSFMQKIAFAFPQYWVMKAIRQAQSGTPLPEIGLSLLILVLFAALFFALQGAARRRESALG